MSDLKTRPNEKSVQDFLEALEPGPRRDDAFVLRDLFQRVTGREPVMWGDSIVGYGSYTYTNSRGEFSWMLTGFSPRKRNLTLYIMQGFENFEKELQLLGKTTHAKSCLYIRKLSDVDLNRLESFLGEVTRDMESRFECR